MYIRVYIYIYIERERERERGTTLESRDCPVRCAALTASRLPNQAPAAPEPLDPGGGGPAAPPPGEGNEKVRDITQGGKKVFTVAVQIPVREGARPVPRGAVHCGKALQAAAGIPPSTDPAEMPSAAAGTRITGAWTLGLTGRTPRGGVRRAARDRGDGARPWPWPHATARPRARAGRGVLRKLSHQWGAALLVRAARRSAGHEPALDVAPGVPRRLRQPLGSAGPLNGRFLLGMDGLGSHGPPFRPSHGR